MWIANQHGMEYQEALEFIIRMRHGGADLRNNGPEMFNSACSVAVIQGNIAPPALADAVVKANAFELSRWRGGCCSGGGAGGGWI